MRKLAIMVALATTALATPAMARDNAWYVGIEGGGLLVEDSNFDIGAVNNGLKVDHEYGYDVDGIIGYDFGPIRIEGEVGYKRAENEALTSTVNGLGGVPAGRYESKYSGSTSALSFMVNGLLDFGANDGLNGYVGGGAGMARVKADNYRFNGGLTALDDSDTRFAWQAIAGVRYPVTENVDLGLKYRFFNVDDLKMTAADGQTANGRFRSHSLLASLVFNFGEPTPPPPAPVEPAPAPAPLPPEPAPAPAPAPIPAGPFIVFFDWNKSDITPEAATILDNAAQAFTTSGSASVMLAGHADKSGSPQYNVGLSQRRADAVKAYLAGKGISDGSITTEAFGESRPLVETADGVREPQNRRVEITYGPGSGM